ncbi:MAG: carbon-nitrogen hydrolase family protein [Gemmatimonadaceae bacterium]
MTVLQAAVVQGETRGGYSNALEQTRTLAADAARHGARLVVFPETWIPGYPIWFDVCRDAGLWDHGPTKRLHARYAAASVDVAGTEGAALSEVARSLGITLVVGVSERISSGPGRGTLYNAMLSYGPDGVLLNHHRKLMPTHTERLVWGLGDADGLRAVDTPTGRVGGLICWEHWMPLARQALHESGEDIHVAAWPTAHERNQIASRQHAFEGRCFVLVAGSVMRASSMPEDLESHPDRVSSPDDWVLRGGSAIIGPDGHYLVEPRFDEAVILYADLALDRVREESMALDVTGHYSRPDCLTLNVRRTGRL